MFQATFLVLLRDAHTIRRGQSVGSWLYGAAHRLALQARAGSARRSRIEGKARTRPADDNPDLSWKEAWAALIEERGGAVGRGGGELRVDGRSAGATRRGRDARRPAQRRGRRPRP